MKPVANMILILAVAVAFAACKKDKKAETIPTNTGTGGGSDETAETGTDTDTDDMPDEPAVDPASLTEIIYFEFDSSELSDEARTALNENAEWLREDEARTLRIEGHTDEVGTPEYNLGLGERRANAAKDYLVRLGIDADRVEIITFGEEKPASGEDSENRRSVFIATKQ